MKHKTLFNTFTIRKFKFLMKINFGNFKGAKIIENNFESELRRFCQPEISPRENCIANLNFPNSTNPLKSDTFKTCDSQPDIDREAMYDQCVIDMCEGTADTEFSELEVLASACFEMLCDTLSPDDGICTWAETFNSAPDCPANSFWSSCAKTCEIKTCGRHNSESACDAGEGGNGSFWVTKKS
jgi:hypothetical protein